jgi:ribosomal protein S18 acetylase RimI-like enzyme
VMWAPHSSDAPAVRPLHMSSHHRHFISASALSLESVADLYTRTFADYFYNAFITAAHMQMFVQVEQLDLTRSPVLYIGDEPVGLATVGLRGERAYCKGFGIVAPFRGRGLAAPLCEEVIRQTRLAGARTLQLGVMQQNERAVKTYLHAGLHVWRELHTFEWERGLDPIALCDLPLAEPVAPAVLLDSHMTLHAVAPIWGRDLPSLREMAGLTGLAVPAGRTLSESCTAAPTAGGREPAGRTFAESCTAAPKGGRREPADSAAKAYVLYETSKEGTVEIMDIAATRVEQAVALLAQLQQMHRLIVCNNEPDRSPMLEAFHAAGFRETIRRFEMVMDL